uniref:Apolipoprotein A-Ib n=1 Tax=Cyprinus carpio TaxID=7962 RepID=A0A8C2DE38_CYPCA
MIGFPAGGAGHVHTTAIFAVTGFPYIIVLRIEEVACLCLHSQTLPPLLVTSLAVYFFFYLLITFCLNLSTFYNSSQVLEATKDTREKLVKDVEELRKKIEPMRAELRQVLEKHFQEYRDELKPFVEEYLTKHQKFLEEMRTKLEPLVKSLREKIGTNWEETKSKLMPILEAVREKVAEHLQDLKKLLEPYMQDYREQMEKGAQEFRQSVKSGELRKKMNELGEEVKPHFMAIFTAVQKVMTKE